MKDVNFEENTILKRSNDTIFNFEQNELFKDFSNHSNYLNDLIKPISNLPVLKNYTVEELQKLNETNSYLVKLNEQYLDELKSSNENNRELQNIIQSLRIDLESERTAKNKSDKKAKIFEYTFIVLSFIVGIGSLLIAFL